MNTKRLIPIFALTVTISVHGFAQDKNCISIGSWPSDVKNVQGTPSKISKLITEEIWYYKESSITFEHGKVSQYDNAGNNLKICKEVYKGRTAQDIAAEMGYLFPERSTSTATKTETEAWILKKLNEFTPDSFSEKGEDLGGFSLYDDYRNATFTIESGYLVVR